MKIKMIMALFFVMLATLAFALSPEKIYFLNMHYNKGMIGLLNISIIFGYSSLSNDNMTHYKAELLSANREILYSGFFDIPNKFYPAVPQSPDEISRPAELEELNFSISLPYSKDGTAIRITEGQQVLLIIDVSPYADHCGDLTCQFGENMQNCPADCKQAFNGKNDQANQFIQENVPIEGAKTQKKTLDANSIWMYAALILTLLIGSLIYFNITRRAQAPLKSYISSNLRKGYTKEQIKSALIKNDYTNEEIEEAFRGIR